MPRETPRQPPIERPLLLMTPLQLDLNTLLPQLNRMQLRRDKKVKRSSLKPRSLRKKKLRTLQEMHKTPNKRPSRKLLRRPQTLRPQGNELVSTKPMLAKRAPTPTTRRPRAKQLVPPS